MLETSIGCRRLKAGHGNSSSVDVSRLIGIECAGPVHEVAEAIQKFIPINSSSIIVGTRIIC